MTAVKDLIAAYVNAAGLRGIGETQTYALAPIARFWANVDVAHVDVAGTTRYIRQRKQGLWTYAHAKKPAKDGTIRRELGALNAVLAWAHKRGLVDKLVSVDMPPPSPPRMNFMSEAQVMRLWNRAETHVSANTKHRAAALFAMIALDTGARAASIEGLTWGQVSFVGRIDFRTPGKVQTAKRQAVVPMSDRLKAVLINAAMPLGSGRGDSEVCGPVSQYAWNQFLDEVGLPGFTRHDLRRTFASLAVARGVDILKVATALGDNVATVLKHYAHFSPNYLDGLHEKTPGA